ncbi:UDP-2,3-diacylglucosamine diphosphatase [Inquilinus sp. KBS0705]|nr:UDP-2,3-diacylglucosamine diphosphatase [Inquilinus sp. KBS0705]
MPTGNKLYFASDFHLGANGYELSREREDRIVRWLDTIKVDAAELFLVGDVFDFWFEYKTVIPKGYTRFLGKLAELTDAGIKLYLFKGNHDMWMFDYFEKELNATIISNQMEMEQGGKKFYIHHGDGLGPFDYKYKTLKKIFRSRLCQWLFARVHPNLGVGIASRWSRHSRIAGLEEFKEMDNRREWLEIYSTELLQTKYYDYFIFGHRHKPLDMMLAGNSRYINLGEWVNYFTYAVFDGDSLELKYFEATEKNP